MDKMHNKHKTLAEIHFKKILFALAQIGLKQKGLLIF